MFEVFDGHEDGSSSVEYDGASVTRKFDPWKVPRPAVEIAADKGDSQDLCSILHPWSVVVTPMSEEHEKEIAKGRVPLWLDPADLKFVACEYSRLPESTPDEVRRLWMRIAVRANAALQKAGHAVWPFAPKPEDAG
jgi:hypothetical protein